MAIVVLFGVVVVVLAGGQVERVDADVRMTKGRLARLLITACFELATSALNWPGIAAALWKAKAVSINQKEPQKNVPKQQLRSAALRGNLEANPATLFVGITVVVAAVNLLARQSAGEHVYAHRYLLAAALGCGFELLTYAISPESLPVTLRKAVGNPYLKFISIAVLSYLILTLSLDALVHGFGPHSLGTVFDPRYGMFDDVRVRAIFSGQKVRAIDYFAASLAVIYCYVMLRTIFGFGQFKRTDEDIHRIVLEFLLLGSYAEAGRWLSKVQTPTGTTFRLRAMESVGLNNISKAMEDADRSMAMAGSELSGAGGMDLIVFAAARLPLDRAMFEELIMQWLGKGGRDEFVSSMIIRLVNTGALLQNSVERIAMHCKEESYPMFMSFIEIIKGNGERAGALLEPKADASACADSSRRCKMLGVDLFSHHSPPARQEAVGRWVSEDLPVIRNSIGKLNNDIERFLIAGELWGLREDVIRRGGMGAKEFDVIVGEVAKLIQSTMFKDAFADIKMPGAREFRAFEGKES